MKTPKLETSVGQLQPHKFLMLRVIDDMHAHVSVWQSHHKQCGPGNMTNCILIDIIGLLLCCLQCCVGRHQA